MNHLRYIFSFSLLVFAAVSCTMPAAGIGSIVGAVTETSTGEPIQGVSVKYGTTVMYTDELGRYALDSIPDGLQGLVFSKTGFSTLTVQVDVHRDDVIENNVSLPVMSNGWAAGNVDTDYGTIFYSEDGGASWVRQGSRTVIPPDNLLCVCAVNTSVCWVAGDTTFNVDRNRMEFSILKTSDSGQTWRRQGRVIGSLSPCPIKCISAIDTSNVFAATDANIILMGTKGGENWSSILSSDHIKSFKTISTCDGVHLWAGGSAVEGGTPGLEYSSDAGTTWTFLPLDGRTDSDTIKTVSAIDTNLVYIAGTFGVMCSEDHGATWSVIPDAGPSLTISTLGSFNAWTALAGGSVLYTYDAFSSSATSVISAPVDNYKITAISFTGDVKRGAFSFVSDNKTVPGGILCTDDYGASWDEAVTPYKVTVHEVSFAGTRH